MHTDFESVSMVTSQCSLHPVLRREGQELRPLPAVSMWTGWHFKNVVFCFWKNCLKAFNFPISDPSLQKKTINMISSCRVKNQDAHPKAVGSRGGENPSGAARARDLTRGRREGSVFSGGSRRNRQTVGSSKDSKGDATPLGCS